MSFRPSSAPKPGRPKGVKSLDPAIAKVFGTALQERRLAAGMSQEFLALTSGIERSYLSRLERGVSQPTLLAMLKLAKGLGCETFELLQQAEKAFMRRRVTARTR
ncbi:helix-turn-helix domain-containing protein [Roseateles saccharophilus]|uniref:helix-turn-helix domain-containing protein n=1 Tax=Roseateles saccharophilus TaxID=304 RepID=UPI0038F6E126